MAHAQTADSKADTSLSTVVVTASGTAVDIKEAPASISVITREDIHVRLAENLFLRRDA